MKALSIISLKERNGMSEEIDCDYCQKTFPCTKAGVTDKTIHMILTHASHMSEEEIEKGLCFEFTKKDFEAEKKLREMMK